MFGKKKHQQILLLMEEHASLVGQAVYKYERLLDEYLSADKAFKAESRHIDELESRADKVRFNVEYEMYKGAFLPTQREDFITALETLDRVANKAEDCGDFITLVRPPIPPAVAADVREIATVTVAAFDMLVPLLKRVLAGDYDIREQVKDVGRLESQVDRLQFHAVREAYKSKDLDKTDKLTVLMALDAIAAVSDQIENAGDKLSLIAIKRKLA
jgi:predicted phosphate transport protein (TIGR00153 family)